MQDNWHLFSGILTPLVARDATSIIPSNFGCDIDTIDKMQANISESVLHIALVFDI